MIRKSRLVGAIGLTLALGVSSLAFAVGTDNNAKVLGKVSPSKLDKKKKKPVNLYLGLENDPAYVTGTQSNPSKEEISIGKNVSIKLSKTDQCTAPLINGSTPAQARAQCPPKSYIGSGSGAVTAPGGTTINDIIVSVFAGGGNVVKLHAYSPTLQAASPGALTGRIVGSNQGGKYGQMLVVDPTPETGSLLITKFDATIAKSSKVATANCKAKSIPFLRHVTYKDGTSENATLTQKCKRKGGKKK